MYKVSIDLRCTNKESWKSDGSLSLKSYLFSFRHIGNLVLQSVSFLLFLM